MQDAGNIKKIEALRAKKETIKLGGGADKLDKQREQGKMTARERIDYFFDKGTFVEVGGFIELRNEHFGLGKKKVSGDGVVTGFGKVNGKVVYVGAQDFSVLGGSLGEMHGKKIANILDLAYQSGCPAVMLNDSGGARIQEGIGSLCGYGEIFYRNTKASGVIPQISLIMGPCAGGAVYSPGITDFVVMVDNTSNMFITGPEVIKTVTNENVTKDDLGGSEVHLTKSGVATYSGKNDKDALDWVKVLLSYIPSNNEEIPEDSKPVAADKKFADKISHIVPSNPKKAYDIKEVISALCDKGSFFELQAEFAKNIVIGFARVEGQVVGVIANQPLEQAGCIDVDASDKAARFVRFCDAFNVQLLTLVDVPGFLPGVDQEYTGIIRHGAKLLYAYSEASVGKITVILRKAYGGAYICMCSKHLGADSVLAWPNSEIAVMGPKGAVNIIFKKEITEAADKAAKAAECENEYLEKFANPQMAASLGYVDDVIEPEETRRLIALNLEALRTKQIDLPSRKHGNIPL